MKKSIVIIWMCLLSSFSFGAGHVTDAKIETLYCGYVGTYEMCSITFNKPIEDKDQCHTNATERMQFKPDTSIGQAILSVALAAQAAQKYVNVRSTGQCTIISGFPDVNWVTIKND